MELTIKYKGMSIPQHIRFAKLFPEEWRQVFVPQWIQKPIKFFTRKRYIETSNRWLHNKAFDCYLWLMVRDKRESYQHEVSDYLGPIDTLGSQGDVGYHTASHSCEMFSAFFIHPFNGRFTIEIYDGCEKLTRVYWSKMRNI